MHEPRRIDATTLHSGLETGNAATRCGQNQSSPTLGVKRKLVTAGFRLTGENYEQRIF